ncbi:MAG: 50S ribosomal protein L6 [Candidatus Sungbacteria bacterium]|nr:50S ribosomal protein L6 [Candidatus Sungbacteria bacterium]
MSRIGKKPILIPPGVEVSIRDNVVTVKGPKGELSRILHSEISADINDKTIVVSTAGVSKKSSALWGLSRSLIANMVEGVTNAFRKKLDFEGIGFRASIDGGALQMQLGFSHPVRIEPPEGIAFLVEKNVITILGIDKEAVGNTAARIRRLKPVEPYKGKGIKYQGEIVKRKAGKKAVASA